MTFKEFMRMMVETESEDERMALAEEHMDTFSNDGSDGETPDMSGEVEELTAKVEELTEALNGQKQKYKDRFFSNEDVKEKEETKETDETDEKEDEEKEKPKTLKDLGYGK